MFPLGYFIFNFIEFFNLRSVNCHAEYKLVGTKLQEIFSSDHSYLFLKTIFTCSLRSLVKIVAETNTRISDRKFPAISYPLVVLLLKTCNDLIHYLLLSAKYSNLCKTDTSVVVMVLGYVFLLAEKIRHANNEGSSWKSTAK
jgi:hypothetical protein